MTPAFHHHKPNASCVGVGGGVAASGVGSLLARRGVRVDGHAVTGVRPGIATRQSS